MGSMGDMIFILRSRPRIPRARKTEYEYEHEHEYEHEYSCEY